MKKFKNFVIGLLLVSLIVFVGYVVHENAADRRILAPDLASRKAELSPRGGPPQTIEELRQVIALYEEQVERHVRAAAQTGAFWGILGFRLAERNMHRDALDAFEQAINFNTEDAVLYYMTGVSAGMVAKSIVGFSRDADLEREHFLRLSENAYLRAIELNPRYIRPMYGLGVLYVFELDRPEDAIVHLERLLEIQPADIQAMFVLARAHFMERNFSQAIELYDRIIARTRDARIREEAFNLREIVQGFMYG